MQLSLLDTSIADRWKEQGIILDKSFLHAVIVVLVAALFLYGLLRALYQWLHPFALPKWLGKFLMIDQVYPNGPKFDQKKTWREKLRTFLIISAIVLASRVFLYLVGYVYKEVASLVYGGSSSGFFDNFVSMWNRWDSPHYIDIARDWYVTEAQVTQGDAYLFIVFFPLFPLLMRIAGFLVPGIASDAFYFYAGCVISNLCLCIGCYYFFRLVKEEYDKKTAIWALLFLLFTPASLFFGICYTESLFLCLCVVFYYYLRKGNYMVAGVLGALAAFTRSLGVLLVVPFFVEWFNQEAVGQGKQWKNKLLQLWAILIIPLGTIAYLWLNQSIYGDALQFMEYQKHWSQSFSFFITNIADIGVRVFFSDSHVWVMWLPEFLVIVGTIVLFMLGSGKKIRPGYLAFIMVYIVVGAAPSWLLSGVRYFAVLFPVYMLLARFAQRYKVWGSVLLGLSFVGMVAYTVAFVAGMHVM